MDGGLIMLIGAIVYIVSTTAQTLILKKRVSELEKQAEDTKQTISFLLNKDMNVIISEVRALLGGFSSAIDVKPKVEIKSKIKTNEKRTIRKN